MIRLTLIFLPFLFILLPTCYLVGSLVIEKIKLEFNKAAFDKASNAMPPLKEPSPIKEITL